MPIVDFLLKAKESDHANQKKLAFATEHMLRKILEGLGLNIKEDTKSEDILKMMTKARLSTVHIVDKPGDPMNKQVRSGYYFFKSDFWGRKRRIVFMLFEPFYDKNGKIVIEQWHP